MNKQQRDRYVQLGKFNEALSDEDNEKCNTYFGKENVINMAFDIVRKGFDLNISFGNYLSDVVFITDFVDTTSDALNLIKIMVDFRCEKDSSVKDFYSMYYTQYNKTMSSDINEKLLDIELKVINPNMIVNIGTDYVIKNQNATIYNIDKSIIENMKRGSIDDEYKNSEEYKASKSNFISIIDKVIH